MPLNSAPEHIPGFEYRTIPSIAASEPVRFDGRGLMNPYARFLFRYSPIPDFIALSGIGALKLNPLEKH
jgi:hypothetical protein